MLCFKAAILLCAVQNQGITLTQRLLRYNVLRLLNDNTAKEKQALKPLTSVSAYLLFNNRGDMNIVILFFQDIKKQFAENCFENFL